MDPILKDAIESFSWLVASLGGVAAAWWAIVQFRDDRRWKQSDLARNVVNELWADQRCVDAMVMVDWSNREFELDTGEKVRITREELLAALRTDQTRLRFSRKEVFIRDCFDSLLDGFQKLQHYIDIELIVFQDIKQLFNYTVAELSGLRPDIDEYIRAYDFTDAKTFLGNYDYWAQNRSHARPPCIAHDG